MAKTILKTTNFKGTWMGRKGTSTCHHLDKKLTGLRVTVQKWEDNDEVEVELINGDGRRFGFVVLNSMTVPASIAEAVVADMVAAA